MTTVRYHLNLKTTWFWISLFIVTFFMAITGHAQAIRMNQSQHIVRRGYEISTSIPVYSIKSNVALYDGLKGAFNGVNLGYVIASDAAKVKFLGGMYYAGSSFQQTIINFQGGVTANLYLLQLGSGRQHTFEPYFTANASRQQFNFYGGSILNDNNQSVSEERYLGNVAAWQGSVGIGTEFRLENDMDQFIHFFAEARYGTTMATTASTKALNGTSFQHAFTITLGINIR